MFAPRPFLSVFLSLVAILVIAQGASAADPLVWKWAEGDTDRFQLTQEMRMSMNAGPAGKIETTSSNVTLMRWTAESLAEDGSVTLRQETDRVVMTTEGPRGQGFRYDSDSEDPPVGMATLIAPVFEAMCEHPFRVTMAPSGKVGDVVLSDELTEAFDKMPGGGVSVDMVRQIGQQGSIQFPEGPLEVGQEWTHSYDIKMPQMGAMKVSITYTYVGPKESDGRELEAISAKMTMDATGQPAANGVSLAIQTKSSNGEFLFDREAGRLVRSKLDQLIEMQIEAGGQQITNVINQSTALRRLAEGEEPTLEEAEPAEQPAASLAD